MVDGLAERRQQGLCLLLQAPRTFGLELELLTQGREFPDQVDQAEFLSLTVVPRRLDAADPVQSPRLDTHVVEPLLKALQDRFDLDGVVHAESAQETRSDTGNRQSRSRS